ncbi:unnamed protein product [Gulo gulo]|uniref:Uncharacterized protein n=1 Tax=Gulo gulo TaxID=48420 RepID=A0A9X9MAK0_GULGU|nr:unnamed protein product [Gulo gulo]
MKPVYLIGVLHAQTQRTKKTIKSSHSTCTMVTH